MVFGADKKLVPSSDSNLDVAFTSGSFKGVGGINSYGNMVNAPGAISSSAGMAPISQSEFERNPAAGGIVSNGNILGAATQIESGKNQLKEIQQILEEDKIAVAKDKAGVMSVRIPETDDEITAFLQQPGLENQPTEVLHQMAE